MEFILNKFSVVYIKIRQKIKQTFIKQIVQATVDQIKSCYQNRRMQKIKENVSCWGASKIVGSIFCIIFIYLVLFLKQTKNFMHVSG